MPKVTSATCNAGTALAAMHIKSQCLLGRTCYWHERRVVPAPLGGLRKRHACKLAATAAQLSIRQFSRNQDPVAAAACEETLTQVCWFILHGCVQLVDGITP